MKQFFASLAANLVTIAIVVVAAIVISIGVIATAGSNRGPSVRDGSVLIVDLESALSDAPGDFEPTSALQGLLSGSGDSDKLPLRSAIIGIREAASDSRITGMLIRGHVTADGYASGFAALKELREAIVDFRARSKKPVHAYLVNGETKDYYVASAASVITLDPFGALTVPGLASEELFFAGLLEKYGIGVQVSRVGRYKSAVEPFLRADMSPENRQQVKGYLGDLWSEVKRGIASSRKIDTLAFQQLVDREGILQPAQALSAGLIDRIAYFDVVIDDLKSLGKRTPTVTKVTARRDSNVRTVDSAKTKTANKPVPASLAALLPAMPQITLDEYATVAGTKANAIGARQSVAIVYAEGDIVDGQGGAGMIGGDALAKELRRIRTDDGIRAVVLRVNSPGGSAVASETIQRELALMKQDKPVVVSMGTVAASGGYWITTAASRVFAEPNTITGSIGVFSIIPNFKGIANKNGVTFDTVKTGKYADLYSVLRPRTPDEMAVLQRGVDVIYNAFIERVATARHLTPDSVRVIAEGRVWSGEDAMQIGLVDSLGNLDAAVKSAAGMARLVGDYGIVELPHRKGAAEVFSELLGRHQPPVARIDAGVLPGSDPLRTMARSVIREIETLLVYNDPRNMYARMPYVLHIH